MAASPSKQPPHKRQKPTLKMKHKGIAVAAVICAGIGIYSGLETEADVITRAGGAAVSPATPLVQSLIEGAEPLAKDVLQTRRSQEIDAAIKRFRASTLVLDFGARSHRIPMETFIQCLETLPNTKGQTPAETGINNSIAIVKIPNQNNGFKIHADIDPPAQMLFTYAPPQHTAANSSNDNAPAESRLDMIRTQSFTGLNLRFTTAEDKTRVLYAMDFQCAPQMLHEAPPPPPEPKPENVPKMPPDLPDFHKLYETDDPYSRKENATASPDTNTASP
jgi:hypothetical protein